MKRSSLLSGVALIMTALLGLGCAQVPQLLAALRTGPVQLKAWGPGTVFGSIDAAAVDALTYAYLQAEAAHNTELMRGGTIYATRSGYSYGEIHVAGPLGAHREREKGVCDEVFRKGIAVIRSWGTFSSPI